MNILEIEKCMRGRGYRVRSATLIAGLSNLEAMMFSICRTTITTKPIVDGKKPMI